MQSRRWHFSAITSGGYRSDVPLSVQVGTPGMHSGIGMRAVAD
jgi:hypothetical protein